MSVDKIVLCSLNHLFSSIADNGELALVSLSRVLEKWMI